MTSSKFSLTIQLVIVLFRILLCPVEKQNYGGSEVTNVTKVSNEYKIRSQEVFTEQEDWLYIRFHF